LSTMEQVVFETDGAATSGTGSEELSGETFFISPGMHITDLFQTSCGTLANDADWQLYIDGIATRWTWTAEELDPASVGRPKLPKSIGISPGRLVQFKWSGQAVAASNKLKVQFLKG